MKCLKCGHEFFEGVFCPECGAKYDEAEAKKAENEEIEKERARKEEQRKAEEEKKAQDEIRRKEESEKRKLELEKAKVEQERLAVEKAAHEAELARQLNEKTRIEDEKRAKYEAEEKKRQEELSRTFNGVTYGTIEEMNVAKRSFEEAAAENKEKRKLNAFALWCLILAIASFTLILTVVFWIPVLIVSIVLGIMAIKNGAEKRGLAIAGLSIDGIFLLIWIIAIVLSITG